MYLFALHAINFIAHLLLLFGIKQALFFTLIFMLWAVREKGKAEGLSEAV